MVWRWLAKSFEALQNRQPSAEDGDWRPQDGHQGQEIQAPDRQHVEYVEDLPHHGCAASLVKTIMDHENVSVGLCFTHWFTPARGAIGSMLLGLNIDMPGVNSLARDSQGQSR